MYVSYMSLVLLTVVCVVSVVLFLCLFLSVSIYYSIVKTEINKFMVEIITGSPDKSLFWGLELILLGVDLSLKFPVVLSCCSFNWSSNLPLLLYVKGRSQFDGEFFSVSVLTHSYIFALQCASTLIPY